MMPVLNTTLCLLIALVACQCHRDTSSRPSVPSRKARGISQDDPRQPMHILEHRESQSTDILDLFLKENIFILLE